ncbi:SCO family protein [Pseudothauera rhizosphaerae]|uniref:Protein SCO1/2 n=1 Tax=Pseudothauera rhizosphaerae TaxID=2565932 RepID=A0A4S4AS95_9RHOO|nr:SCO family protein [Pseudothauera rhizosphaerae]THF61370.1 hypothetical protein E6O51_11185 [Pseudothauera rhizosphaerae]
MKPRGLCVLALLGALACAPAGVADEAPPPEQRIERGMAGWPLAEFALRDHHGAPFANARLLGRWTFVLVGETRCGAPCDQALAALAGMNRRLAGTAKAVQVLFVSAAPERDPPAALAAHLADFDARFVGATAAPEALAPLLADLAAGRRGSLFLVGPDGALRAEFLPPFDVRRLTAAYLKLRLRG